jgi:hypothetical protein
VSGNPAFLANRANGLFLNIRICPLGRPEGIDT